MRLELTIFDMVDESMLTDAQLERVGDTQTTMIMSAVARHGGDKEAAAHYKAELERKLSAMSPFELIILGKRTGR